jgi:hypothetical protein
MKKMIYFALLLMVASACNDNKNVYSELLKEETELIEAYILRQGIEVIESDSMPEVWGENDYWKVPEYDNYYFHLVQQGDTMPSAEEAEVQAKDQILLRFKRYSLDVYADTLSNWNTLDNPNPVKFQYLVNSEDACDGWQLAVQYMKYNNAQCKIICPSKMGFSEENSSVTPYAYDLKIIIKRY